jgi:hypothetical protein
LIVLVNQGAVLFVIGIFKKEAAAGDWKKGML